MIGQLAEQLQVEQDLIERRVADALADAERGAVDAIGAVLDREDRVDDAEPAIVVAVPVDADVGAADAVEHVARELEEVAGCRRA